MGKKTKIIIKETFKSKDEKEREQLLNEAFIRIIKASELSKLLL